MLDRVRWFLIYCPGAFVIWRALLCWIGHRAIPWLRPRVKQEHIKNAAVIARPGDIIGVRSRRFLTSYLIPGKYKHTAVYTGQGWIIHAVSLRICQARLDDFLSDYDGFVIMRPKQPYDWKQADRMLFQQLKRDYDFLFYARNEAFYCHELSACVVAAGGVDVPVKGSCYTCDEIRAVCDTIMEV